MLLLSLTKEPCLLEVMDDALVVPTVVQVVGRFVTKLARQGCELVEELPELRRMYSYRVFAAHLHAVLEGMNSLSFWQIGGMLSLSVGVHEGCCNANRLGRGA